MKVFITGSTGTVGGGVLERCLAHPQITSVVALTRRPLDIQNLKLNNIIHKDFLTYNDNLVEQLKGSEACIWYSHLLEDCETPANVLHRALGSPTSGKEVHVDYTNAVLKMCREHLVPQLPQGKKFRFVYTSGGLVPYLDSNALFFLGAARKLRGDMDRAVVKVAEDHPDSWESYIARPWYVLPKRPAVVTAVFGENAWIHIPQLGAAMVDAAMNGSEQVYMDCGFMKKKGEQALKVQPN